MDRRFLVAILAVLLLFALPYAFADKDDLPGVRAISSDSKEDERGDEGKMGEKAAGTVVDAKKIKREEKVTERNELLGEKVFTRLKTEQQEKLNKLNPDHLQVFSRLSTDQLSKIRNVDAERLRVLALQSVESLRKISRLHEDDIEKLAKLDRSRIKEFAEGLTPTEIKAKLESVRVFKAQEEFKFRPLELEQTKRSKVAFEKLKENEEKLREKYEERKEKLVKVRERVRACKNDTTTEDCADAEKDNLDRAKEHALSTVERLLSHLEKVKEKVANSENLPEDDVEAHLERLDALIAEVNELQATIEAATAKGKFNEAVKTLRKIVSKVKKSSITRTQALIRAQTLGVIHRAEIMEKKMDCSLGTLDEAGEDTSTLDAKVEEFSQLIADARAKIKEAKETYDASDKDAVAQSRALLKDARDLAQEAQQKLVEVKNEILDLGGTLCIEAEVAVDESEFEVEEPKEEESEVEEEPDGDENETNTTTA